MLFIIGTTSRRLYNEHNPLNLQGDKDGAVYWVNFHSSVISPPPLSEKCLEKKLLFHSTWPSHCCKPRAGTWQHDNDWDWGKGERKQAGSCRWKQQQWTGGQGWMRASTRTSNHSVPVAAPEQKIWMWQTFISWKLLQIELHFLWKKLLNIDIFVSVFFVCLQSFCLFSLFHWSTLCIVKKSLV